MWLLNWLQNYKKLKFKGVNNLTNEDLFLTINVMKYTNSRMLSKTFEITAVPNAGA